MIKCIASYVNIIVRFGYSDDPIVALHAADGIRYEMDPFA